MKRVCFTILLIGFSIYGKAQNPNIDELKQRLMGIWQNVADSNQLLNILQDNIAVIDSNKVILTYTYSFNRESCNATEQLPAAAGVYLLETYNGKSVCCAIGELSPTTLKITYPAGKQVTYKTRSGLPPNIKPQ
ncbi:MAG TPA: hypothetical protein VNZ45_02680 [Bacteroidia bacterium]|jgi:hypothetical protein|nr:hypothetical protein [Bacteroidia bacterium]